jgi:preprotein translocase subunit YajC
MAVPAGEKPTGNGLVRIVPAFFRGAPSVAFPLAVDLSLTPPPQGQNQSMLPQLILMGLIFLIFYFLVFRPGRMKQKKLQAMLEALKPGDKVVTSAGIHGTVVGLSEDIVQLRIADNVKVEFSKSAVVSVVDRRE